MSIIRRARAIASRPGLILERAAPFLDRRTRFNDLSAAAAPERAQRSHIIEFYSSNDNIGNYTPTLGMYRMMRHRPDVWCMHRTSIDFDWVNSSFDAAIIGGAGLLHECFSPFWRLLAERCTLPMIIWGVGVCMPDEDAAVADRDAVREVATRCDLINLRDSLSADAYGLRGAHISVCPTVVWLRDRWPGHRPAGKEGGILLSIHTDLSTPEEARSLHEAASRLGAVRRTDNIQEFRVGIEDIIERFYLPSRLVVTTRLHGAIIAYGLGIPYLALAHDEKIRAFHAHYGGGVLVNSLAEFEPAIAAWTPRQTDIADRPSREFGELASAWADGKVTRDHRSPR